MMLIYNFCTGGFNRVFPDVKLQYMPQHVDADIVNAGTHSCSGSQSKALVLAISSNFDPH